MTRIKCSNVQIGENFLLPIESDLKAEETKLQQMIMAANAQKNKLINEGMAKAKELVEEAKQILQQAQDDAQKIIEQANAQANNDAAAIKDQAQKEGFEAGRKQGYEEGTKELEQKVLAVDTFAKSQYDIKQNIIKSAELDILDLVTAIARKVCKKSLDADVEVLKNITTEAIKLLKDKENITITVNPALAEVIYSISDDLKNAIPQLKSIKVIEDSNISADGTIVETPLSRVDSRLKIQIDQIAEKLMEMHYTSSQNPEEETDLAQEEIEDALSEDSSDDNDI